MDNGVIFKVPYVVTKSPPWQTWKEACWEFEEIKKNAPGDTFAVRPDGNFMARNMVRSRDAMGVAPKLRLNPPVGNTDWGLGQYMREITGEIRRGARSDGEPSNCSPAGHRGSNGFGRVGKKGTSMTSP